MNFNAKLSEKDKQDWLNSTFEISELNTLGHIRLFLNAGWDIHFHHKDIWAKRITVQCPPHFPVSFVKGTKHIWKIRNGWQTADLIDGSFCNHKPVKFDDILELFQLKK